MSASVDLVEQFAEAFNRRDLGRLQELCHPEIEFATPDGATLRGHEGAAGWATKQWDGNTPAEIETDRIQELANRVVHHGRADIPLAGDLRRRGVGPGDGGVHG
jgi:limonene-1,2-epoxide hydrolase